eukprot:520462-Prymnesium_polylepis.1
MAVMKSGRMRGASIIDPVAVSEVADDFGVDAPGQLTDPTAQVGQTSLVDSIQFERRVRNTKPWWVIDPRLSQAMAYWDGTTAVRAKRLRERRHGSRRRDS